MSINTINLLYLRLKLTSNVFRKNGFRSLGFFSKDKPIEKETTLYPETQLETTKSDDLTTIVRPTLPIITSRKLQYPPKYLAPRQAWVENLDTIKSEKLGMVDLHPAVFAEYPRIDLVFRNVDWQMKYKKVVWDTVKTRAEKSGGGRKPWPQKGLGKARHGSIRSPLFIGGGKAHGPRGPKTFFFMLPFHTRVRGLTVTLSIKFAQNDVKIVDSLDLPSDDPKYLEELAESREWGPSILFIDNTDFMPKNIAVASNEIKHMNLMPVYGLNVYSLLKHETLVLTLSALEKIEERLLYQLNRLDWENIGRAYKG